MTLPLPEAPSPRKPIRLWPGVAIVALQWIVRYAVPAVVPGAFVFGMLGGIAGGALVLLWWLFISRVPWAERLGAVALLIAVFFANPYYLHESVATSGRGMLFLMLAIPGMSLALVLSAAIGRLLADLPRRLVMAALIVLAAGGWALVRTSGVTGDFQSQFQWRWSTTPEERLLARAAEPFPAAPTPAAPAPQPHPPSPPAQISTLPPAEPPAEWPGFRGPGRDGIIRGARIATDWSASPPVNLWRRPVGPGWSSFAVQRDRLFTQEQRGPDEIVACYNLNTGAPLWAHRDRTRFYEATGGPGPRATPALAGGRVFALGATGILNALDAATGVLIWSRNLTTGTGAKVPYWGFAGSPLVLGDLLVVAASGRLAAYDLASGNLRWLGPEGRVSYSSPHFATLGGVAQILLLNAAGAVSVAPADGKLLWEHAWTGSTMLQPAISGGNVLLSANEDAGGIGIRRLAVLHEPAGWRAEERWTSAGLKPFFNDFVVHDGHLYGFDARILACIGLEDGARKWKGGRYGHGQLILLTDQSLLLVLSEEGGLALVTASPGEFKELARFPAIEGKTWNHPVLVRDILLVRNDQEMAAYRLAPAAN